MEIRGKGTSWEIKPGIYQYRFSLGKDPETGKYRYSPKRTIHCTSKNKMGREAELRKAMEAYRHELETGIASPRPTDLTVGEYADRFHARREGTLGSELSWEREALDIEHIKELFGEVKLKFLKPPVIKDAYARARKENRFSPSELHKLHAKLSQIMKEAVIDELVTKNPCDPISVPRPKPKERRALSAEEAARLASCLMTDFEDLSARGENRVSALQALPHIVGTMLLLETGMRRGEMLGLDWAHVDLEKGSVYVAQQFAKDKVLREPKSRKSKRHLHVSARMAEVLGRWKGLQGEYLPMITKRQTPQTPVANNDLGQNMDPDNYNRWFRGWCVEHGFGSWSDEPVEYRDSQGRRRIKRTGYSGLTPHMLRHTQATLLIGEGEDIKTVQSRLGHSSIDMTLNTYAHAIEAKDAEAAEIFSRLLDSSGSVSSEE